MIEQLCYTRPPASAGRDPGFQIVGASAGLSDTRLKLTSAAIRLCRYDPPPRGVSDESPVSYGWIDAGGFRFGFRRASAGVDELGRAGNFTAHVLAGPPELLRARDLAARFDSTWWWDGKIPDDPRLPALSHLSEMPVGQLAGSDHPADRLAALVDALLARRPRTLLSLRANPSTVAALVLAAEQALPGLMDAHGVSTYEGQRAASWFDVAGVAESIPGARPVPAEPEARVPPEISKARRILLSPDRARVTITAARAAGIGTSQPHVTALPGLIAAYDELDAGTTPSAAFLANSLASPEIAKLTLDEFPATQEHIARELIRERGPVFDAVKGLVTTGFDPASLDLIGAATSRILITGPVATRDWDRVLARLTQLNPSVAAAGRREILNLTSAAPDTLDGTSISLRLDLLRQAAADEISEEHPAIGRILVTLRGNWRPVADDRGFPLQWRAIALVQALAWSAPPGPVGLAQRLVAEPQLAGPLSELTAGSTGALTPLLEAVRALADKERAAFVLTIAAHLQDSRRDDLVLWYAEGLLEARRRFAFMASACKTGVLRRFRSDWAALARATVAELILGELEANAIPRPVSGYESLLAASDQPESSAWSMVLALANRDRPHLTPFKTAVAHAVLLPAPEDSIAVNCAATFFVAGHPSREQFEGALAVLAQHREDPIRVLATACQRVLHSTREYLIALDLGCIFVDLAASGAISSESPRARLLAVEFRRLEREIPGPFRRGIEYHAQKQGDAAYGWWRQQTGMLVKMGEKVVSAKAGIGQVVSNVLPKRSDDGA